MSRRFLSFFFFCLILALFAGSCDDESITSVEFPTSGVSYSQHIQPYFTLYCATSGCHDNQTMAGIPPLSLTSWSNAMANPGVVRPGDPDASVLVQKLDGRLPHELTIPIIATDNHLQGIRAWIEEGALNN